MSMDEYEARREAAYDEMVDEILRDHKVDIIERFQEDRLASFFISNPQIAAPAERFQRQAAQLVGTSNSAALVLAFAAVEYFIKNVFLKPVVCGLIHDEDVDELVASIVVQSREFQRLLFEILAAFGADIRKIPLADAPERTLEEECNRLRGIRNNIVHRCEEASEHDAMIAIKLVNTLHQDVFPTLLDRLGIADQIKHDGE